MFPGRVGAARIWRRDGGGSERVDRAFQDYRGSIRGWIGRDAEEATMLKGGLLWLIGIPIPIIVLLWLLGVFH